MNPASLKEASLFLNQKIDWGHCCKLIEKSLLTKLNLKKPEWHYFDYCVSVVQKGIQASKFDFNRPTNAKLVTIKLS